MFNVKLEEKSCKMNFTAVPVKIQRSKNRQGRLYVRFARDAELAQSWLELQS